MRTLTIAFLLPLLSCVLISTQSPAQFQDNSAHQIQFISIAPDVRLEVLDWGGTGRPVVFLAGYLTAHAYDDIAPKLTATAHVYGITRRGLGASSKPLAGYTATESAEDVLWILNVLKLERPILVGHSFGGQDLNVIGATQPTRIAGLVYLDSVEDTTLEPIEGFDPDKLPAEMRAKSSPDMRSFAAYREWQQKTAGWAFPEAELRQIFGARPDGSMGPYLVSKDIRDAMFAGLQAPQYDRIRVPVVALFALPVPLEDQIRLYKPQNAEEGAALGLKYGLDLARVARQRDALKRGVSKARTVEVPGASTYIFLSNETDVLQELRRAVVEFP
jgi:pimeloyl-ACP methyl ester carboxylesterase